MRSDSLSVAASLYWVSLLHASSFHALSSDSHALDVFESMPDQFVALDDVDRLLHTIVSHATKLLNTTHGFLYLVDQDDQLTLRVGVGWAANRVGQRLQPGEGLSGKVWQNGRPLLVERYSDWEGRTPGCEDVDLHAVAAVPLVVNQSIIGVLGVGSTDPHHVLDADQLDVLERFAPVAAIAIHNARLYNASRYQHADRIQAEQSLRESIVRYRTLFERTNDGVMIVDLSGVVVAANHHLAAMLGYTEDDMIGLRLLNIVAPREHAAATERLQALVDGHTFPVFEGTFVTKDGVDLPVEINVALVRNSDGTPLHIQSIIRNITQRKQAERALRKSEALFRAVFAGSAIGIVLTDVTGRIVEANAAVQRLTGYTDQDLCGRHATEFLYPEGVGLRTDRIAELLANERTYYQVEHRLRHKHGHLIWTCVSVSLMQSIDNDPPLLVAMIEDITERKQAEQALRDSEAKFRSIVESLSEGLMIADVQDVVLYVNQQMADLTGYSVVELLGKPAYKLLLPPSEWGRMLQNNVRRMQGISERYEVQIVRKDGSRRWIRINATPLRNGEGDIIATLGAMSDITEHKRIAHQRAALAALGQHLSMVTTDHGAAHIVATVADELIGWDAFSLSLYNPDADVMYAVLDIDLIDGVRTEVPSTRHGFTPGPHSRRTLDQGPQLMLPEHPSLNTEGLMPFGDTCRPSASLMFVPIKRDARPIGILSIQSYTPNAYTNSDLETLQMLADHCSGALERIRVETALREAEARYREMVENANDIIYVHTLNGTLLSVNKMVERLTGYTVDEVVGQDMRRFVATESIESVQNDLRKGLEAGDRLKPLEIDLICKDGSRLPVEINARLLYHGDQVIGVEGIARDVRDRRQAEATIRRMAFYDSLTSLPNRVLFNTYLNNALSLAKRHGRPLAVLFVDLDRFKMINDTLGHHTGDLLLQAVAQRLADGVREGDTIARMGGDEFTILLPEIDGPQGAAEVAQRLLEALAPPFVIQGHEIFISASIGISLYPIDGYDAETLLKHADTAMYRAKDKGRNDHQLYVPAMDLATQKQYQMEQSLRRALERQEFEVFYQPCVRLNSGALVGAEALVRWRHPDLGLIDPVEFIPLAEDTGLIVPIGAWIMQTACAQAVAWQQQGMSLRMSVNLSARQFNHVDLVPSIAAVLERTGLDAQWLELEISESIAMLHAERTVVILDALKQLGVRVSIDDFGTGYSSLRYLKQFSLDALKIDRTVVHNLSMSSESAIAEATIVLAHTLALSVTAEGVETEAQRALLLRYGCDKAQGFLIGEPMPADVFTATYVSGCQQQDSDQGSDDVNA